ncbi:hypothetical protein LB504_005236 [Fusarium proliferatum]|nr:hypothetical protein LB504_005236 [Fusarium proliferatum]
MDKEGELRFRSFYHPSCVLLASDGVRGIIGALAWCQCQTINRLQQKLIICATNEPTQISTYHKQDLGRMTLERHMSRGPRIQMLEFRALRNYSLALGSCRYVGRQRHWDVAESDRYFQNMVLCQRLATVRCIVIAARILACKVAGVAIMTGVIPVTLDLLAGELEIAEAQAWDNGLRYQDMPSPKPLHFLVKMSWVLIDCEHGHIDDHNMYLQISAISSSGVSPVVRIPAGEPWMVKRALDAGAHAIMVPMCETKEEAIQIVESAKYPSKRYPNGFRGTGAMFAPAAFNLTGRDYLLNANSNVMVFVQIESSKGVENVEEIAKVDGIDMLFIGPNDLASSLGYVAFDHATTPEVQQTTQRILDATLAAGKYAGHFALDAATAAQRYEQGFHFVNCGADIVALTSQMSAEIRKVKDLTKKSLAGNDANGSSLESGVEGLEGRDNDSVDAMKLY